MKKDSAPRAPISYCYRFGTAEFDEARFELRVAGLPVDVERRALEVLAYLLQHAGEVVTKEELFGQVWAGRITVDNVLPNAIAKLRRALGETNAERLRTQPRIGYRLDGTVQRIAVGRKLSSRLELTSGQTVPARENFTLQRQLGSNRGSEVWLAEHAKTHERRVYKFAADGERLRALKREATLSRVLQESLDGQEQFVHIIDWNFEHPPFFLESEYGGENLLEWCKRELQAISREERLALFVQIVEAVAAAHSVGVLHKDLKPANVLVDAQEHGRPIRLTDFGSGRLLDQERLEALGISQQDLGTTQNLSVDSSTGTPLYVAPEVFSGHAATVQSDVFALGIMLYQLISGDLNKPMASGWEQDIGDELLCEDIRLATHGNPARRLTSAAELALRLRNREQRREQAELARKTQEQARRMRDALTRSRARRPYLFAFAFVLMAGTLVSLGLFEAARRAGDKARFELERANAINRFLNEDLIGQSNPLVLAKGQDASLKDVLLKAQERISLRFASQPLTEASVHASLSKLFGTIELLAPAEAEARKALSIYAREEAAASTESLKARIVLAHCLIVTAQFDPARSELNSLDRLSAGTTDRYVKGLVASAWGDFHLSRSEYAEAMLAYQHALSELAASGSDNLALRDSLRLNLIHAELQNAPLPQTLQKARELIDEMQTRRDKNWLGIALAQSMLAHSLALTGDYANAEALLLEAQKTVVAQLGAEHSQNLTLLNDLLDIATRRGDWPEALERAQRLYAASIAKFGTDHLASNVILGMWGQILYQSGNAAEAAAKLEPAYQKLATQMSVQNPQTQYVGFWLAAADIELGKTDQAAALLASLKTESLQSVVVDGAWEFKLQALQGLLLSKRGDMRAALGPLQSAVNGMKLTSTARDIIYGKAILALANSPRKKAYGM